MGIPGLSFMFKQGPQRVLRYKGGVDLWITSGREIRVRSSNVYAIAYDQGKRWLAVTFLAADRRSRGKTYTYEDVPTAKAKRMFHAPSMGRFVWYHLRNKHKFH